MDESNKEIVINVNDEYDCSTNDMMSVDISSFNNFTYSTTGAVGASGSFYISTGAGSNGTWSTQPYNIYNTGASSSSITGSSGLHVTSDASFEGDIKWKGRSLGDMLSTIEKRLAILTPDPAKLEHFEALQKAYNHYKTLEALCEIPEKKDDGS
jgi:hypothetical protein